MNKPRKKFQNPVYLQAKPWFPRLVFFIGVLLTLCVSWYIDGVADTKDALLLQNSAVQTTEAIDKRLDTYIALLNSTSGLLAVRENTTWNEFHTFVSLLDIETRYKGVQGIGFAQRISAYEKASFQQVISQETNRNFTIYPDYERPEYTPIVYLEPENERNRFAIGFDMATEANRKSAMEQARDTGLPVATKKVVLVQETDRNKQPGFLIYMPVYSGVHQTVADRQANILGYVYSPFRARDFFESVFGKMTYPTDLYVFDGDTIAKEALLYSRTGTTILPNFDKLHTIRRITFAGRIWTVYISPSSNFVVSFERRLLPAVLLWGGIINTVLFFIGKWQFTNRSRLEKLAMELYDSREALQYNESRLRRIIDANIIGVFFAKSDGRITEANNAFLKLIGYTATDVRKQQVNINDAIAPEYKKLSRRILSEAKKRGFHAPFEKEYIKKDGTRVPVLVGTAYIKGKSEERLSLVVDLTERKKLERQKDDFISIASHELKTPVTSLKAYAQVLERRFTKRGDTDSAMYVAKMDTQLNRLTNLIKDLLDVTKIQAGKLSLQNEVLLLPTVIVEIVEEMQRTTEQHILAIHGSIKHSVFADKERVGQVLINLLSNAIKYSPTAKKVEITMHEDASDAIVCVRDFGVGIPKAMQKKVFDRFFRVSGNKEETFPGLGLGLYISAEIIKRQKGKIWVTSEEGKGSMFCFSLPSISTKKRDI